MREITKAQAPSHDSSERLAAGGQLPLNLLPEGRGLSQRDTAAAQRWRLLTVNS